ncbi:inorganic phosphate transporter [Aspergillus oryzae 100-8]|uniref:Inorganic phosphate transporter n=1 Tax=Aspergillus oryzae (strain 3.042) TaxID=1160506 RepID=I8AC80_ASPO3|nr:inorganic phosphate transporter [Aspergillus oryzae 3.042]KDE83412.1 inorganic phosphate transporter [Aspergillus oryzae 100-8]|eukprot:EIT83057.1 inorganic phosphate transporter [Aspergillus oryzae 3.042]
MSASAPYDHGADILFGVPRIQSGHLCYVHNSTFARTLFCDPQVSFQAFTTFIKTIPPAQRRNFIISQLESARRREWLWVVVVAGVGFFADAYCIFSVNMVVPMISEVYWGSLDAKPDRVHNYEVGLSIITLAGALVGQVLFGIAADIWGRRKMYGLELVVLIFSTLGMSMASSGKFDSMSIIGVLLFWRFFMGLGVGADYPLSAIICSELAPTRIRGRMLAAVFLCQSLGEAAAAVVALIAVAGFRHSLPNDPEIRECTGSCVQNLDSIWRLIVGLGAVPAFIAIWFRLTIIESPRYTTDVLQNSLQAAADVSQFYQSAEISSASSLGHESLHPVGQTISLSPTQTREYGFMPSVISRQPSSVELENASSPPLHFWRDLRSFLKQKRNLRTLVATSLCWFCLDLPFYGLGLMNVDIINTIWYGNHIPSAGVYESLLRVSYQSIVVVSSGAIVGSCIAVLTIDRIGRRNLQLLGFCLLFILNVIIGASFRYLSTHGDSSALVVLYVPAELFPTRFRATCHGISAASGKLGSILAQCFLGYVDFGNGATWRNVPDWLGYALLCLSFFMLMGLIATLWIPETRDKEGNNKSLERITEDMQAKDVPSVDEEDNGSIHTQATTSLPGPDWRSD